MSVRRVGDVLTGVLICACCAAGVFVLLLTDRPSALRYVLAGGLVFAGIRAVRESL